MTRPNPSPGPYPWCALLASINDVLGTALAEALKNKHVPGVLGLRHRRVCWYAQDFEGKRLPGERDQWTLYVAVLFESDNDVADGRPIEETHWQLALALHQTAARFAHTWATLERFGRADPRLRAYHRPRPGVTLPLPPPRPAAVIVAPATPTRAPRTEPTAPAPTVPTQRGLFE